MLNWPLIIQSKVDTNGPLILRKTYPAMNAFNGLFLGSFTLKVSRQIKLYIHISDVGAHVV